VLPLQLTESVAFGLSPPQPTSAIGRTSKPNRQGHINVSIDSVAQLSRVFDRRGGVADSFASQRP
jgi:hypothetical protein